LHSNSWVWSPWKPLYNTIKNDFKLESPEKAKCNLLKTCEDINIFVNVCARMKCFHNYRLRITIVIVVRAVSFVLASWWLFHLWLRIAVWLFEVIDSATEHLSENEIVPLLLVRCIISRESSGAGWSCSWCSFHCVKLFHGMRTITCTFFKEQNTLPVVLMLMP